MALKPHHWQAVEPPRLANDDSVEVRWRCLSCHFYAVSKVGMAEAAEGKLPSEPGGFCGAPWLGAPLVFADGCMGLVDLIDGDREIVGVGGREVPVSGLQHDILRSPHRSFECWFETGEA